MIDKCSSSANCWFVAVSLLIADLFACVTATPEDFLSKNLLKQVHVDIHHILDF